MGLLFWTGWLLVDVGISVGVITGEIFRGFSAASIAVDALLVDIVLAWKVFGPTLFFLSHKPKLWRIFGGVSRFGGASFEVSVMGPRWGVLRMDSAASADPPFVCG